MLYWKPQELIGRCTQPIGCCCCGATKDHSADIRAIFMEYQYYVICYSTTSWALHGCNNWQRERERERSLPVSSQFEFLFLVQPQPLPLRCNVLQSQKPESGSPEDTFASWSRVRRRQLGRTPKTTQSNRICFCSTPESRMSLNTQRNYYSV